MKYSINIFKKFILLIMIFSLTCMFTTCSDDMCWVCVGMGNCYKCSGKTQTDIDSCPVCKGTRICFNCKGSGKAPQAPYNPF